MNKRAVDYASIGPYCPHFAQKIADILAEPGDTIAKVASEFADIFATVPNVPEKRASLLRALAIELHLAGLVSRLGQSVASVNETAFGLQVLPRFNDKLVANTVEGFEKLSQMTAGTVRNA